MRTIDIEGNEYVINLSQSQYDDCGGYWIQLAERRAEETHQTVVIAVNDEIYYRATSTSNERMVRDDGN